jgi:hypothetical protein
MDPTASLEICGSGANYARALRENHQIENLDYSFVKLPLAVPEGKFPGRGWDLNCE